MEKVADAQTPQPVLAAVRFEQRDVTTSLPKVGLVLVLHDLRDPGNVGTIIRSADAAGATAVVLRVSRWIPTTPRRFGPAPDRSSICRSSSLDRGNTVVLRGAQVLATRRARRTKSSRR